MRARRNQTRILTGPGTRPHADRPAASSDSRQRRPGVEYDLPRTVPLFPPHGEVLALALHHPSVGTLAAEERSSGRVAQVPGADDLPPAGGPRQGGAIWRKEVVPLL